MKGKMKEKYEEEEEEGKTGGRNYVSMKRIKKKGTEKT